MKISLRIVPSVAGIFTFAAIGLVAALGAHAHIDPFATRAGRIPAPAWTNRGHSFPWAMSDASGEVRAKPVFPAGPISEYGSHRLPMPSTVLATGSGSLAILAPPKPSASTMIGAALLGMGILRMVQRLRRMP